MKNLTLVVPADIQQALADTLRSLEQLSGFTFTHVEGHGPQDEANPQLSARDRVIGFIPHLRVDMLLNDKDVEDVLQMLRAADCGLAGRCSYQVTTVEKQGAL